MSLLSLLRLDPTPPDPRSELLRDLQWLLNATTSLEAFTEETGYISDQVQNSVLNYGMPPLAGFTAHKFHQGYLQEQIRHAIERFEPRLIPESINVSSREQVSDSAAGIMSFEIKALMRTKAGEEPWAIMSRIDLDSGEVILEEI